MNDNMVFFCFKIDGGLQTDVSSEKDVLRWMWVTVNDGWMEVTHFPNMILNIEFSEVVFVLYAYVRDYLW